MVATTHTFTYSGTLQEAVIPAGTTSLDMYLWGGAGGAGGADSGGAGGSGSAGMHVKKTTYTIATSLVGTTVQVGVGGGGAGGSSGTSAAGGANGKGKTGFSGGNGGTSGPRGNSGAGGGGGGATTVFIDGSAVATAGGGGGGAGAGSGSNGTAGINSNSATTNSPATRGEEGVDHSGDGGGSGAGGGGAAGGKSGNGGTNDNGGTGGFSGSNLVPSSGSESLGSGVTPGGTSEANYQAGVAVGGAATGGSGANGLAVVVFNIGVQGYYKVSGDWKALNSMYAKVSGVWKQITAGYVKVSGTWKAMFNNGFNFVSTASGFGDATGNTTSGTGGSGPPIPQSGGCFIAGTMISMADGSQKAVEQVDIGDEVSVGGKVFATGKFLIENLYDYNGIQVSGTHMVKEDGAWTRVEDSRLGVSLGNDPAIVYVFGSEHRRIIINNTEFTDYFELSEQQELTNHGEQFFSNWQDHDRQIHDKNVNILNA